MKFVRKLIATCLLLNVLINKIQFEKERDREMLERLLSSGLSWSLRRTWKMRGREWTVWPTFSNRTFGSSLCRPNTWKLWCNLTICRLFRFRWTLLTTFWANCRNIWRSICKKKTSCTPRTKQVKKNKRKFEPIRAICTETSDWDDDLWLWSRLCPMHLENLDHFETSLLWARCICCVFATCCPQTMSESWTKPN